tara:strand:- start:705 stop:1325 length:621 start_codon:yes stop_codon:yes gene_type:complete
MPSKGKIIELASAAASSVASSAASSAGKVYSAGKKKAHNIKARLLPTRAKATPLLVVTPDFYARNKQHPHPNEVELAELLVMEELNKKAQANANRSRKNNNAQANKNKELNQAAKKMQENLRRLQLSNSKANKKRPRNLVRSEGVWPPTMRTPYGGGFSENVRRKQNQSIYFTRDQALALGLPNQEAFKALFGLHAPKRQKKSKSK